MCKYKVLLILYLKNIITNFLKIVSIMVLFLVKGNGHHDK